MKKFNEYAMIAGMCTREQDARDMQKLFNPQWLKDTELVPIMNAIFACMTETGVVPSIPALGEYLQDKDEAMYNNRYKGTLELLKGIDDKQQILAIKAAKDAAATYALHFLLNDNRFVQLVTNGNADAAKKEISLWLSKHSASEDEGLFSIQEAFDKLIDEFPFQGYAQRIKTGIKPIDDWCGGLRSPQLGIIAAPTGHGKSTLLMNLAYYAAAIEDKVVLFITNELTVKEQAERFMARLQDRKLDDEGESPLVTMSEIQEDPTRAYTKLKGYRVGLNDRLFIYSANLGQDIKDIDNIILRLRHERGVMPDVIVIDYMERMSAGEQMDRGKTWTYYGQIAKELVYLAKRRNTVIWTAVQTNRAGMNEKTDLSIEQIQGSIQHIQEASYTVGVRKVSGKDAKTGKDFTGMEFKEMKSRHGKMEGRKMIVEANLALMHLTDNVIEKATDVKEDDGGQPAAAADGQVKTPDVGAGKAGQRRRE